jgi:hypothetical protein
MGNGQWIRRAALVALAVAAMVFVAGCDNGDPGALGAMGVDGLSNEQAKQDYTDGVGRALQQLGSAQGQGFGKAVDTGNKKQLQAAAIAWQQGLEQLKQVDPPKDVVAQHVALVKAVETLDVWNKRVAKAAPNKFMTRKLGKQASASPASKAFAGSICDIVDAGYDVVDSSACTPLAAEDAQNPAG